MLRRTGKSLPILQEQEPLSESLDDIYKNHD
jgi:hypothetical protein